MPRRAPATADDDHNEWNTPPEFLADVRRLDARRRIGLDPCSNATSLVNARTNYTLRDNGLAQPWRGHGLVFVNPEYTDVGPWVDKGLTEFVAAPAYGRDQLVMLITAKTDTQWFHKGALRYPRQCFVEGRIKFLRPVAGVNRVKGNGRFASLVLYAGEHVVQFEKLFGQWGWVPPCR
jgi:phage N-6-adenine-methyltransferase